jgi:hypothetical protein
VATAVLWTAYKAAKEVYKSTARKVKQHFPTLVASTNTR